MKITSLVLAITLAAGSSFAAAPKTPALPFGDMRFVAHAQIDDKPVPTFMPSPFALKEEFVKRKLSGEVVIGFTISAKGKPEQIKIMQSTNRDMAKIASAYVSKLVFRPARLGGKPVACDAEMPFFAK